jgi:hypothetical protein
LALFLAATILAPLVLFAIVIPFSKLFEKRHQPRPESMHVDMRRVNDHIVAVIVVILEAQNGQNHKNPYPDAIELDGSFLIGSDVFHVLFLQVVY